VALQVRENLRQTRVLISQAERQIKSIVKQHEDIEKLLDSIKVVKNEIEQAVEEISATGKKDPVAEHDDVLKELLRIFNSPSMIGPAYEGNQLSQLYLEGKRRYAESVPPGYMDQLTKPEPQRYGDLIIWKQLIDYSRHQNRPVMFITDDVKEDWWFEIAGVKGTRTPHPKLRQEFIESTGNPIWFYEREQFLREAKKRFSIEISEDTIREVEEVAEVRRGAPEAEYSPTTRHHEMWNMGVSAEAAKLAAGLTSITNQMEAVNTFSKLLLAMDPSSLREEATRIYCTAYPWITQSLYKPGITESLGQYPGHPDFGGDQSQDEDSVVANEQERLEDSLNQDHSSDEDTPDAGKQSS
jgi:hypothetical protein